MKIAPINGRVIGERVAAETKKGSLILTNVEKPDYIRVIAVSNDSPVAIGDLIVVEKYTAQQIMLEDVEYVLVKNENIIGIISIS